MPHKPQIVSCPQCGKSVVVDCASLYHRVCAERSKLIDRVIWASESYRIPVAESKDSPETDEPGGAA